MFIANNFIINIFDKIYSCIYKILKIDLIRLKDQIKEKIKLKNVETLFVDFKTMEQDTEYIKLPLEERCVHKVIYSS